jgi:hypothetical protein
MPLCTWAHPSGLVHWSVVAHNAGLQRSTGACSRCAATACGAVGTLDVARGSMAHRRSNGDKVNRKSTYKLLAMRCYTHTSMAVVGRWFSPEQWAVGGGAQR